MEIRVESYAGHKGEETPRRFYLGESAIEVDDVVDRWLAPDHAYFKVLGAAGDTYILRHDEVRHAWELVVFHSAAREAQILRPTAPPA